MLRLHPFQFFIILFLATSFVQAETSEQDKSINSDSKAKTIAVDETSSNLENAEKISKEEVAISNNDRAPQVIAQNLEAEESVSSADQVDKDKVTLEEDEKASEDIINEEIIGHSEAAVEINKTTEEEIIKLKTKSKNRIVLGWVEPILLGEKQLSVDAKLTPGTAGNSLHADNIKLKEKKDGSKWVDFEITDKLGRTVRFHKKIISMRKKKNPADNQYKVTLEFCLNFQHFELDFIVSDRSDFEHPARIGRDSLAGHFIIDPGLTKTSVPSCNK